MTSPAAVFRKLAAIPPRKLLLLAEATAWLTVARIALRFVPFPSIGRHLGVLRAPAEPLPAAADDELRRVRLISWAVNTAGSHLPVAMVCLPRALAAWQMLHRRGIASRLHFGALKERKADGQLETHAWLSTAGMHVTGYPAAFDCVELGFFARTDGE